MLTLLVHFAIWFPQMAQSAFTWEASPHIWTRELLGVQAMHEAVDKALPGRADVAQAVALEQLAGVLKGDGRLS